MTLTEKYIRGLKQRDLGGTHIWIKPNKDALSVYRGRGGVAEVELIEGDWTEEEIEIALGCYEGTEASKR